MALGANQGLMVIHGVPPFVSGGLGGLNVFGCLPVKVGLDPGPKVGRGEPALTWQELPILVLPPHPIPSDYRL